MLIDNSIGEDPPPTASRGPALRGPRPGREEEMRRFVRGMFTRNPGEAYLERLTSDALRTPPAAAAALGNYAVQRSFGRRGLFRPASPSSTWSVRALPAKRPISPQRTRWPRRPCSRRRPRAIRRRSQQVQRVDARFHPDPGSGGYEAVPWPLFLVSGAAVGFEIALTRYFAVAKWSEYGYWVISIVMAGFRAQRRRRRARAGRAGPPRRGAARLATGGDDPGGRARLLGDDDHPFNPLQLQTPPPTRRSLSISASTTPPCYRSSSARLYVSLSSCSTASASAPSTAMT